LAGRRILRLQIRDPSVETTDQLMMEFELCIGLIFKPLRHHMKKIVQCGGGLPPIWLSVLSVVEDLLNDKLPEAPSHHDDEELEVISENLKATMNSLANEHLQNAIKVLLSIGVLSADDAITPGDITANTWESVRRMGVSDGEVQQWKQDASSSSSSSEAVAGTDELTISL
jgi:hypothetical protein